MIIYYDNRIETICFGMESLKESLEKHGVFYIEKPLNSFIEDAKGKSIVISTEKQYIKTPSHVLESEGFEISLEGNVIYVTGKDNTGAMYGLLDMAETINLYGIEAVKERHENPYMKMRGIKFNLPFEPYDMGDPFEKNVSTCLDINFWRAFIDFLAGNRYNCLSLWSEHPFHMMFRLQKYPDTCPYSETELEKYMDLYKFIFGYAKRRGIKVYLITWNIRITPFVAKGLGLPEEVGDMFDQYNVIYDSRNDIPNNTHSFDSIRQSLPVIKDYFKECIKTLAITYRDLEGIGTNCAEEMAGDAMERQNWVAETYLEGVRESGRDLSFIMRTNMGNGKIAKKFLDEYPGKGKYISWKYSNAHMHSSANPRFEKLWGAWDDVNMDDVKVIYTVRNDDFHTLRWGDHDYIKAYIKGMKKPYVHGFYWGADGYIWADDFQHIPHGHKTWKYDFEKHWHEFELLGRLGYNPEMPEDIWIQKYKETYGPQWGETLYKGMKEASKIIPAVNRLFWINFDFEWHPESLLTVTGFKTVLDFMNGRPMPEIGTVGLKEFVENQLKGIESRGETPMDIINILKNSVEGVGSITKTLRETIPEEYLGDSLVCAIMDLEAWKELGKYYFCKFSAAMKLLYYKSTGEGQYKSQAVEYLEDGLKSWEELSRIWSLHYMPYKMTRSKHIFGWPYYIDNVKNDIRIARSIK